MTHPPAPLIALVGELPALLPSRPLELIDVLRSGSDRLGAVIVGFEGRPLRLDPVSTATALTVDVPGLPVLVASDGVGDAPYNAARRLLSLDHLSGGRGGVVFVSGDADATQTSERIRVIRALWNSWPRDTLLADRERGVFATTDGIRRIEHAGAHYRVAGALNSPTSRQGEPVSVWRVSSEAELDAARGLVDLVVVDDPRLVDAWHAAQGDDRPGLVTGVDVRVAADALAVVAVRSVDELRDLLADLPARPGTTLRERLGLPERAYDLSDKPLAFGGAR